MSKHAFSVAYDGLTLAEKGDHSIEVQTLAPALMAFGKLIREANAEFNGKKSTAKVLVVSDFEHKCFNINFEAVIGIFQQLKTLVGSEDVKSAKEILQWLGLLGVPSVAALGLSFLTYLRQRNGRKVEEAKPLSDVDKSGIVQVRFEGAVDTVHVHTHVYQLSENSKGP